MAIDFQPLFTAEAELQIAKRSARKSIKTSEFKSLTVELQTSSEGGRIKVEIDKEAVYLTPDQFTELKDWMVSKCQ